MRDFTGVQGASGSNAVDGTRWTPEVGNSIVQEIGNVVTDPTGGDVELDPDDDTQLLTAIKKIVADANELTVSFGSTWHRTSGDGWVEQGGVAYLGTTNETAITLSFPEPFSIECLGITCTMISTSSVVGDTQLHERFLAPDQAGLFIQSDVHPFADTSSFRWRAWGR
jgi:hypothetical protein